MNILEAIDLTEKLTSQAISAEHMHAPAVRATRIGSQEFPKIEVQVGPVLFSANNEELAIYVPSINNQSAHSPEQALSLKVPLAQASENDLSSLLAHAFGLGVTLDSLRKNQLQPLGTGDNRLFASKDERYFAYDFNPSFQLPGQTLLRVIEVEQLPPCQGNVIPSIHCQPHLMEVMSDQLATAVQAALSTPQNISVQKTPEQKLEDHTMDKLEHEFPGAKNRVQVKPHGEEMHFLISVSDGDCQIEEAGTINALGELSESSKASGPRHKVMEYQQRLLPRWSELTSEVIQRHEQLHPAPEL